LVQEGTQTGAEDFYFYDFESELLARNYVARQLSGLDTAALFLNEAGVLNGGSGQPWIGPDVLSMLAAKVTAARADKSQFTWRLIDKLGLAREDPLDLTKPGLDPATTYLDSVQLFLVLNDLTLGLPAAAGASTEGLSAAATPGPRTKAMHDYSLLAQGYEFVGAEPELTHWYHGAPDKSEDVVVEAYLLFHAGEKVVQGVTAGPLRDVVIPPEGGVPGAILNWFPDASLLLNGKMLHVPGSLTTDSTGYAYDVFSPRMECPTKVGVGQVVVQIGKLDVVARLQVTSVFPVAGVPNSPLGVISKLETIYLQVAHHTGSSTLAAGAVSTAALGVAADSLPPCAYEGTASTTTVFRDPGGDLTWTATASDLRFELQPPPPDSPPGGPLSARYELVWGNVTVQGSGHRLDCTLSGSFSIPGPIDDGVHQFGGYIILDIQNSEYSASGSAADQEGHLSHCSPHQLDGQYGLLWLSTTTAPGEPGRSFTPGGALEGSSDSIDSFYNISVHSEWSLHPAECQPSPEPVCQ
jgi:hypothetical protein